MKILQSYFSPYNSASGNTQKFSLPKLKNDTFERSQITFGWCNLHNRVSSECSQLFNTQIQEMRAAIELKKKQTELNKLDQEASETATKFLLNFANKQKGVAEFIPLWTVLNNVELQKTMDESPVFGDSIQCLISMTNIEKFKMKNPKFSPEMNEQAAGSLQIHSMAILIEQAKRNKHKMTQENRDKVDELIQLGVEAIDKAFGDGTYAQLVGVSQMGEKLREHQSESMEILKSIDARAKRFSLGDEFKKKLHDLLHDTGDAHHHDHEPEHGHNHQHTHTNNTIKLEYHTHEGNPLHDHNHNHHH